jgi:hypothetical protein
MREGRTNCNTYSTKGEDLKDFKLLDQDDGTMRFEHVALCGSIKGGILLIDSFHLAQNSNPTI